MARCVNCSKVIARGEYTCPSCGVEQPVEWMVTLVYILTFLFAQGSIYRLIWPNADSLLKYGLYFAATTLAALVWMGFSRYKSVRAHSRSEEQDGNSD